MAKKILHITNGNTLTDYLMELDVDGVFLTWQEMLCEGPLIANINCEEFYSIRKDFLNKHYDIDIDEEELKEELKKLDDPSQYDEIVLWFEYDLFCHINLLGVMNLLHQKEIRLPLYLVCSGRVPGVAEFKGLAELGPNQLLNHYKNKIKLTEADKELAIALWRTYCGRDHNIFKPYIVQSSSFEYMSNCLKAHLKRFPDSLSGLSVIEENILTIVRDKEIKSKHHLLGYALNYQGFYGFGDMQLKRIINKLSIFFTESDDQLTLNRKGHEALLSHHNFAFDVMNDIEYGGVRRLDFQFSKKQNKLIKTVINAH